jgi:hypothetical protein
MPLCMEYTIIQMPAATSHGGADLSGTIFNGFAAKIWLNLSNGIGYIDCKGIGRCRLIGIGQRIQETPQEKVQRGEITRSWSVVKWVKSAQRLYQRTLTLIIEFYPLNVLLNCVTWHSDLASMTE